MGSWGQFETKTFQFNHILLITIVYVCDPWPFAENSEEVVLRFHGGHRAAPFFEVEWSKCFCPPSGCQSQDAVWPGPPVGPLFAIW